MALLPKPGVRALSVHSLHESQVVVDNEQTGKLLLQKGQLKRRVTIIPLNKISHNVIDSGRMKKARDVAKSQRGNVSLHSRHYPSRFPISHNLSPLTD